ncbi:MAG: nucleotidyltransferase family protein [Acidobacteriota bacterium]|nr:nucleotidyltransferase family protein [Acidobacteriota bacterium]
MKPAGLILSAGESRRMGRAKALLQFHGETFLDALIARFAAVCDPVIVVLGHQPDVVLAGIRRAKEARFVVNPRYALGQLTSMQRGLRETPPDTPGVLFTLVDHPNVSATTLRELLADSHALLAIPVYGGRKGHPIFFRAELIPEFLALPPEGQAREVVRRYLDKTAYVPVSDPGILDDIDDPAAYEALLKAGVGI